MISGWFLDAHIECIIQVNKVNKADVHKKKKKIGTFSNFAIFFACPLPVNYQSTHFVDSCTKSFLSTIRVLECSTHSRFCIKISG